MPDRITREILGQQVTLGALYNAYKGVVLDSSIFDEKPPKEQTSIQEESSQTWTMALSDSIQDKLAMLGVSAETGASVATGACIPTGAGAVISYSRTSNKIQQASAVCTLKTKKESLVLTPEELQPLINLENLDGLKDATHVVVGVYRGGRLAVTLSNKSTTDNSVRELKQLLDSIRQPQTAKEDDVSPDADIVALAASYDIKAHVDFTLKGIKTTTYEGICQYTSKFLTSDKVTMALSVELMPIKEFLDEIEQEVPGTLPSFKAVGEKLLKQIVDIMDDIGAAKKTFNDTIALFEAHPECMPESFVVKLVEEASISAFEKKAMTEVKDALIKARSGSITIPKLCEILKAYVSGKKATSALNTDLKPYVEKISLLEQLKAAGARTVTMKSLNARPTEGQDESGPILTGDVYVFYVSASSASKPMWNDVKDKVLGILGSQKAVVVIVDLDMDTAAATSKVVAPCIQLRRNGKIIVPDVLADEQELKEKCLIRPNSASKLSNRDDVPLEKRRPVVMACPNKACPSIVESSSATWICPTCKEQITFGYENDNLYCNCGSYDIGLAEFRCNGATHGPGYVSFAAGGEDVVAARARLRELLRNLKPFEQYNILIIGATGAGKSTFINAFVNYLLYDTLQDALDAEKLTSAIPGSFYMAHPTIANEKIEVKWGEPNAAESLSGEGQSATQSCVIYAININGKLLRLVDTPGLGDTRGLDQDYKNVADIMRTLESLETLSSILFVIKNNDSRLTTSFDFVLSELMMHLHKDTAKNIMFGFTYGRAAIPPFSVGAVGQPLVELLTRKKLPIKTLTTDKNAFVFDAEGFLYAAAWQQKETLMDGSRETISDSWRVSAEKARLLINAAMKLPVHNTAETLSLERNRRLVESMAETMVKMTQAVMRTKTELNTKLDEIERLEKEGKELSKEQQQYERTSIVEEKLSYPRTVCKGPDCAAVRADPVTGMDMVVFEKSCHEYCNITTPEATFGVRELGQCQCFAAEGSDCNVCRHAFTMHCHVSYVQKYKTETITNKLVKGKKDKHNKDISEAVAWKAQLKADEDELVFEENKVKEAMVKFSIYLGANSVTAYNDGVVEQLKYLMENAKKNHREAQYDNYAQQKAAHEALIAKRKQEIEDNMNKVPTDKDILLILDELRTMKVYGKNFRELLEKKDAEVPRQTAIPVKVSKTGSWKKLGKWLTGP